MGDVKQFFFRNHYKKGEMSEIDAILQKRFQHIIDQENWNFQPSKKIKAGSSTTKPDCYVIIAIAVFFLSVSGIVYLRFFAERSTR